MDQILRQNELILLLIGFTLIVLAIPNMWHYFRGSSMEFLSARAIAQTIANQQAKIEKLEEEVSTLERKQIELQSRLDRAEERSVSLQEQLNNVVAERNALQHALRASGINISQSDVHVGRDMSGGDQTKRGGE